MRDVAIVSEAHVAVPEYRITVVGFEAKRDRFEELHVKALRWNRARWQYVGIGPERGSLAAGMFAGEVSPLSPVEVCG